MLARKTFLCSSACLSSWNCKVWRNLRLNQDAHLGVFNAISLYCQKGRHIDDLFHLFPSIRSSRLPMLIVQASFKCLLKLNPWRLFWQGAFSNHLIRGAEFLPSSHVQRRLSFRKSYSSFAKLWSAGCSWALLSSMCCADGMCCLRHVGWRVCITNCILTYYTTTVQRYMKEQKVVSPCTDPSPIGQSFFPVIPWSIWVSSVSMGLLTVPTPFELSFTHFDVYSSCLQVVLEATESSF